MLSKAVIVKSGNQVKISRAKPILDMLGNLQEIHSVNLSHLVVTADIIPEYMNIETSYFGDGSGGANHTYRIEFGEYRLDFKEKKVSELYLDTLIKLKYNEIEDISSKFPEADI